MTNAPRPDVTLLLERARAGDERARGDLIAQVYAELRRMAVGLVRRERPGHTRSPTAVVHEVVIRMLGDAAFDSLLSRIVKDGRRPDWHERQAHVRPGVSRRSVAHRSIAATRPSH